MPNLLISVSEIEVVSESVTYSASNVTYGSANGTYDGGGINPTITIGNFIGINENEAVTEGELVIVNITSPTLQVNVSDAEVVSEYSGTYGSSTITYGSSTASYDGSGGNPTIVIVGYFDISVSDSETESESVTIRIPTEGTVFVTDTESEGELILIELMTPITVSDSEIEAESVTVTIPTLGIINVSDVEVRNPTIVQSAEFAPSGAQNTIVLTLGSAPKPGNILVAFTAYSLYGDGSRTVSAPDGTWTQIDNASLSNDALTTWWHPVSSGAVGKVYTFTISGSFADWESGTIYEIAGVNISAPINQHGIIVSASSSSVTTPTVTPTVLGTLPLAGITTDSGSNAGISVSSQSVGWTLDQSATPQYHSTFSSHHSLTTDTVSALSNTFNLNTTSGGGVQAIILLTPSQVADVPNIEQVYVVNVSDVETENDIVVDVEIVKQIFVSDTEVESELATIKVSLLGPIVIDEVEPEGELVIIIIETAQIRSFSVYDMEAEGELITVDISNLGAINVSDSETENDTVSDIELINYISVSDVETENDIVIQIILPLLPVSTSDIETEQELVEVAINVLPVVTTDAETESELITIIIPEDGTIFVADIETEGELVSIGIVSTVVGFGPFDVWNVYSVPSAIIVSIYASENIIVRNIN